MPKRSRYNPKIQLTYEIEINDWDIAVFFNEYAYINLFGIEQFEERIYLKMRGNIMNSGTKKIKEGQYSEINLFPSDIWYNRKSISEEAKTIGEFEKIKNHNDESKGDILLFRVSIPTKSYENIRSYLSYKGKGKVRIIGTELMRRKGEIFYINFEG